MKDLNIMQSKPTKEDYKNYLERKVNKIIKPLIVDLLKEQPDDVADFIVHWTNTKGRELEKSTKKEVVDATDDKVQVAEHEIRKSLQQINEKYSMSHLPQSEQSIDAESDEDDEALEAKLKNKKTTQKKNAISAEAYGEYNKLGDFKPRVIEKTEEQIVKIKNTLSKSFMFNTLDGRQQDIVIAAMSINNYGPGDTVIKQGDDGQELFIVGSGRLRCCKLFDGKTEETQLKIYEPGEVFGELSLLYNAPRAASIYAEGEAELYSLDRDTFNHIVKRSTIERRQKYEDFLQKIEILQDLDSYERQKICDCLETEEFKKGDLIIREGEDGDKFYLIQEGQAEALKMNDKNGQDVVFEFKENDYFGELALLNGDKRKATIRVTSDKMVVASLSNLSFKRLLGPIERILERNKSKYDTYVRTVSSN